MLNIEEVDVVRIQIVGSVRPDWPTLSSYLFSYDVLIALCRDRFA